MRLKQCLSYAFQRSQVGLPYDVSAPPVEATGLATEGAEDEEEELGGIFSATAVNVSKNLSSLRADADAAVQQASKDPLFGSVRQQHAKERQALFALKTVPFLLQNTARRSGCSARSTGTRRRSRCWGPTRRGGCLAG